MSERSNGGIARALALSPERKKEISELAVKAKAEKAAMLKSTHEGVLNIGGLEFDCHVLEDRIRVLSGRKLASALAIAPSDKPNVNGEYISKFFNDPKFQPYLYKDKDKDYYQPIKCKHKCGLTIHGYKAEYLPDILDAILSAQEDGVPFTPQQEIMAKRCYIITRGLARVGIIALIDEATGFQRDRDRDALVRYLEGFIINEMQKWARTFPADFFEHYYRLRGWTFSVKPQKPQCVGNFINETYSRLGPNIQEELKKLKLQNGGKMHQYLTKDKGHPALVELLGKMVTLMKACDDGEFVQFHKMLQKSLPIQPKI